MSIMYATRGLTMASMCDDRDMHSTEEKALRTDAEQSVRTKVADVPSHRHRPHGAYDLHSRHTEISVEGRTVTQRRSEGGISVVRGRQYQIFCQCNLRLHR